MSFTGYALSLIHILRLKDLVVDPPQVTVRGPASVIASMKEIQAEIPVDLGAEGKACLLYTSRCV